MSGFNMSEMFKSLGGLKGQMEDVRKRMARINVVGEAGAGMVKVTLDGDGNAVDIKIEPELLKPEEKDMLEELLLSAFNEAGNKSREALAHEMKGLTGGMNIPGIEKLLGL